MRRTTVETHRAVRREPLPALRAALVVGICASSVLSGCAKAQDGDVSRSQGAPAERAEPVKEGTRAMLTVKSSAFEGNGSIPKQHTCEGQNTAPPLEWSGAPAGTQSFALIVDDPDAPDPAAPKRTWVHWVVADIPSNVTSLPAGGALPAGAHQGVNDWNQAAYGGPCPPIGRHRYYHKVYALDTTLGLERPNKAALEKAMAGHVLASGELIGLYEKG